jgi:hypothetical protein
MITCIPSSTTTRSKESTVCLSWLEVSITSLSEPTCLNYSGTPDPSLRFVQRAISGSSQGDSTAVFTAVSMAVSTSVPTGFF